MGTVSWMTVGAENSVAENSVFFIMFYDVLLKYTHQWNYFSKIITCKINAVPSFNYTPESSDFFLDFQL